MRFRDILGNRRPITQSGGGRDCCFFFFLGKGQVRCFFCLGNWANFRRIHHQQLWLNNAYMPSHVSPYCGPIYDPI